jgi:hypothetical protein
MTKHLAIISLDIVTLIMRNVLIMPENVIVTWPVITKLWSTFLKPYK